MYFTLGVEGRDKEVSKGFLGVKGDFQDPGGLAIF